MTPATLAHWLPRVADHIISAQADHHAALAAGDTVAAEEAHVDVDQLDTVAVRLLKNFTVLFSCWSRKLLPAMVTTVPTGPTLGDRLEIVGAGSALGTVTVES